MAPDYLSGQSRERGAASSQARNGNSYPTLVGDGWANLSPKLMKSVLIGLVAGLILLVALVVLNALLAGNRCSFSSSPPGHMTPSSVYTMPDVTNLAKFAGYIHVYGLGFLALDIKRMILGKYDNFITLEDDCVNFTIGFSKNNYDSSTGATMSIYDFQWKFNNGPTDDSERQPYEICIAQSPEFRHTFKVNNHYSCRQRQTHLCRKRGRDRQMATVAEFVIDSFELEIDGDYEKIYRHQFSKPAFPNSCNA